MIPIEALRLPASAAVRSLQHDMQCCTCRLRERAICLRNDTNRSAEAGNKSIRSFNAALHVMLHVCRTRSSAISTNHDTNEGESSRRLNAARYAVLHVSSDTNRSDGSMQHAIRCCMRRVRWNTISKATIPIEALRLPTSTAVRSLQHAMQCCTRRLRESAISAGAIIPIEALRQPFIHSSTP